MDTFFYLKFLLRASNVSEGKRPNGSFAYIREGNGAVEDAIG